MLAAVPPADSLVQRLTDVRRLAAEIAAHADVDGRLTALASAALAITGFTCGQVYTLDDGVWTGRCCSQCNGSVSCIVCNTDPRFTELADRTVLLDRQTEPGRTLLADAPAELAKVLVAPVVVGSGHRILLVLRSDDPDQAVDALTLELLALLSAQSALSLEHQRAQDEAAKHLLDVDAAADRTVEFVEVLSHDLRGPLSTMESAVRLLRERGAELDHAQQDAVLESVQRQSIRLGRLVEDVTIAVLGDHQELTVELRDVWLLDVLASEASRVETSDLARSVRVHADPNTIVLADPDRLAQILQNLVGNAVQHGAPYSPITLAAAVHGDEVAIDVINIGIPIPPAIVDSVFEKFERGKAAAVGERGTGLGLYIARRFAEAMNGTLTLLGSDQDATTFRLVLPRGADNPHQL